MEILHWQNGIEATQLKPIFNRQQESEFETNRFRSFQQHNDVVTREGLTIWPGDTKNLCRWENRLSSVQKHVINWLNMMTP